MKHKTSELTGALLDATKPRIKRDRGSWLAEVPGFRAYDSSAWKAWFRLRCLLARPSRGSVVASKLGEEVDL
jgi:hypothetical protein